MNTFDTILDDIKKRVALSASLQYVAEDEGQLDLYSPNFPVKWPLALIDLNDVQLSNVGHERRASAPREWPQIGATTITVRVANMRSGRTNVNASAKLQTAKYSIWSTIEEIHAKLHNWSPNDFTAPLIRQSINRTRRDDGVQEYIMVYTTTAHGI